MATELKLLISTPKKWRRKNIWRYDTALNDLWSLFVAFLAETPNFSLLVFSLLSAELRKLHYKKIENLREPHWNMHECKLPLSETGFWSLLLNWLFDLTPQVAMTDISVVMLADVGRCLMFRPAAPVLELLRCAIMMMMQRFSDMKPLPPLLAVPAEVRHLVVCFTDQQTKSSHTH